MGLKPTNFTYQNVNKPMNLFNSTANYKVSLTSSQNLQPSDEIFQPHPVDFSVLKQITNNTNLDFYQNLLFKNTQPGVPVKSYRKEPYNVTNRSDNISEFSDMGEGKLQPISSLTENVITLKSNCL